MSNKRNKKWRKEQERLQRQVESMKHRDVAAVRAATSQLVMPTEFDPFENSGIPNIKSLPSERLCNVKLSDFNRPIHNTEVEELNFKRSGKAKEYYDKWLANNLKNNPAFTKSQKQVKQEETRKVEPEVVKTKSFIRRIIELALLGGAKVIGLVIEFFSWLNTKRKLLTIRNIREACGDFLLWIATIIYPPVPNNA